MSDVHITVNGRPPRFCPFEECNTLLTHTRFKSCRRHTDKYNLCVEVAKALVERHQRKPILGIGRYSPRDVAVDLLMKRVNGGTGLIFSSNPDVAREERALGRMLLQRGDYVSEDLADHCLTIAEFPS